MLSLCIIADTHRRHRELVIPPCDLLIHCGDFCSFRKDDLKTLEDADDWFAELPAKKIVCIGGNHDLLLHCREFRFAHAEYLLDRAITVEGVTIYGTPWCPALPNFAFHLPEVGLAQKWRAIPTGIDILITHTPPHGILDLSTSGDIHLGCENLRYELTRIKPKLHVFGHIHASHGQHEADGTTFINAAVVSGREMQVTRGPTVWKIAN